jgi:acyl-CoA thioester hydrolase
MADLAPVTGRETLRRLIQPSDCDHLGHMNVAGYIGCISDAMFTLMGQFGLARPEMEARGLGMVAARIEADYRAELRPGDAIVMHSQVRRIGRSSALFHHVMRRADTGDVVFEGENTSVLFDLAARGATPFPDDIRAGLSALLDGDGTHQDREQRDHDAA